MSQGYEDIDVDIDIDPNLFDVPSIEQITLWVATALKAASLRALPEHPEISIKIVDSNEIQSLNQTFRHKNKATNVLSFPAEFPSEHNIPLLGDIALCAPVINKEANEQNKTFDSHWAHIVIHGTLHLMGYDHIEESEAILMESLEIDILASLGHPCPYT